MSKSLFATVLKVAKQEHYENQQTIKDLVDLTKNAFQRDVDTGMLYAKQLKKLLGEQMKKDHINKSFFFNMYFQILCAETPYSLDSYFLALEFNRNPREAFYIPRRKQLLGIVKDIEDLLIHDTLDELYISQPTRTGKTTLILFTLSWFIGMDSERTNLYASCSSGLVNAFYSGLTEIINDDITYNWHKIFPKANFDKLTMCNSKECYLDIDRKKRYHTFTGRSIDGESLNGACDCNGLLIGDDLCSGIEEALNKDRLIALNMKVNADFIPRAKMNCKKLWIGTRWSLLDPIGKRLENLEGTNIRYKVHNRPALNENGESNFDYLYGVGFSTEYYQNIKKMFENNGDKATFMAIYQGEPIERSGYLFPEDETRYFNVLPDEQPDRVFGFCDPAFGGGDRTVLPVLYKYGTELYCVDFIFDDNDKTITRPRIARMIYEHKMTAIRFESNNGGQEYKEKVEEILIANYGFISNMTTIRAFKVQQKGADSKQIHIFDRAPEIKAIYFLDPSKQSNEYKLAMQQLHNYTIQGNARKKKDDVPDALAKSIDMDIEVVHTPTVSIVKRLF